MKKYLRDIFLNSGFKNNENDEKIDFYFKENQEYFLIEYFSIEELNNFKKDKKTNKLVNFIDYLKKNDSDNKFDDIEKNTSLIIFLKVDDLKVDFDKIKNQVMKIEEDEYFFRKYIIVYDEKWEKAIKKIKSIDELNKELSWWINLEKFRENNHWNSKWFLIIQLFAKLPFLELMVEPLNLENLLDEINKKTKAENLDELNKIILNQNLEENFFSNLENQILDIENKEIDIFIEKLTK